MRRTPQLEAFCSTYNVTKPRVPLCKIAHWEAMIQGLKGDELDVHNDYAHVAPGYFYLGTSLAPDEATFHEYMSEAEDSDWLLIPSIEPPDKYTDQGFEKEIIKIPFFEVAFFETSDKLDESLRKVVGRDRYKEILRLTKKAEIACEVKLSRLSEVANDEQILKTFVALQAMNVEKYSHVINLYNTGALSALANSSDAENYLMKVSYDKNSGIALQASLSYADPVRGIFTQLVQGQNRSLVPLGLNLYISDYYQLYIIAENMGFKCHCLGRGAIDIKKKLGANRIMQLENWLVPIRATNKNAMYKFAASRNSKS